MDSLTAVVNLATSSPLAFVTVVLFLFAYIACIYFIYRGLRDFEVYLLERKRLDDEILFKEEETE